MAAIAIQQAKEAEEEAAARRAKELEEESKLVRNYHFEKYIIIEKNLLLNFFLIS
jgi:hypothetical protein